MRLRRFAFVCVIGACVLAACGTNNLGTTTATQTGIRFINGSPDLDLGSVDVYIGASAPQVTALAYGKASVLAYVNSQAYTVTVTPTGNKATTSLSCTTPSLVANTRYTVVIAGKVAGTVLGPPANDELQCQIFAETIYSLPPGQFQLAFHNASPALAAASPNASGAAAFGLFTNSLPPVYNVEAGPLAVFTAPTTGVANGIAVNALPPGVETAPGVGVYTSTADAGGNPNPPTAVQATLLPSQLQNGYTAAVTATCPDSQNFYPIQTPSPTPTPTSTTAPTPVPTATPLCTVTSFVMSVYAIDAPVGSGTAAQLVGISD